LKDTYDQLIKDVDDLDYKKSKLSEELSFLQNEESKLRKTLKWYRAELEVKTKEVSDLNLKKR
jgi:regulator of replication initiation timing